MTVSYTLKSDLDKEIDRLRTCISELEKNRDGHIEANRRLAAELGKLERMIAEAPVVKTEMEPEVSPEYHSWSSGQPGDTHRARLVQIEEIKKSE